MIGVVDFATEHFDAKPSIYIYAHFRLLLTCPPFTFFFPLLPIIFLSFPATIHHPYQIKYKYTPETTHITLQILHPASLATFSTIVSFRFRFVLVLVLTLYS